MLFVTVSHCIQNIISLQISPAIMIRNGIVIAVLIFALKTKRARIEGFSPLLLFIIVILKRCVDDRLDGMHTVLRLVENDGAGAFEYLVGNLHSVKTEALSYGLTDLGHMVVVCGETVHKYCVLACVVHQLLIYLIGKQCVDALLPDLNGLTHRYPNVGIDNVCALGRLHGILNKAKLCAGLSGKLLATVDQRLIGEILLGSASGEVQSHLSATDHKGVTHIVSGVAHVYEVDALQSAEMLADGEEVSQDLGGVVLVGKTVPDGDLRVVSEGLHLLLLVASVLDTVVHSAENSCGVRNALLLTDLRSRGIEIGGADTEIVCGYLEAATGTGAGLLEYENYILSLVYVVNDAVVLHLLQLCGDVEKGADLLGSVVEKGKKISALINALYHFIYNHTFRVFYYFTKYSIYFIFFML